MKNLPLNEKHLADKLQNVPVPDVDQSWEQMRRLLDRDMPEPAAGAWSGNRKWWWMGITAAIVMVAAWLANPFRENAATTGNSVVIEKKADKAVGAPASDKTSGQLNPVSEKRANTNGSASRLNPDSKTASENSKDATPGGLTSNNSDKTIVTPDGVPGKETAFNGATAKHTDANNTIAKKAITNANRTITNKTSLTGSSIAKGKANKEKIQTPPGRTLAKKTNTPYKDAANRVPISQSKPDIIITSGKLPDENEIESSPVNTALAPAETLTNPADAFSELQPQPAHLAISGKTDKAFTREMRKKSMKDDNRRLSRASMRGKSRDNDHEITFAAGLALPQSFAISGQQSANYNIAAKSSRITDYLPAPFFQYHVNDKMFLQTEFHFQSPQYTQRLLLSQAIDVSANSRREKSQYLEKLYYFNIPFNVYYSPVRNFYVGGGLQYSSLLGGVATYEDKRTEGSNVVSYTSITSRFKDDSAAAVFRPSEWRYQFDANYYFNRFSLGMRYNQAMKDFINMQVGPNTIVGRNRSFLLYLRFNIWEERKKTNN
jgi:hypothetical protein